MSNDLGVPRKWVAPASGIVKCNFHTNWRNDRHLTGGAWITRDHRGDVGMHARDALLPSPDKLSAEMNCLLWVRRSLRDLWLEAVSIGTDSQRLVDSIQNPTRWPRYQCLLRQIVALCAEFVVIAFEVESRCSDYCGSRARETKTISEFKLALYSLLVISLCLFTAVYLEIKDGSIHVKTVVNLAGKGYE
ncbi:unnamed protein product [Brassica oleracea var. botrytis]|uniref:RNase H type-1 domain-containing protein n=2 Tax=Brassica oleracea TaxID=3712 RepID=A0A0D3BM51_BRAOL|nr:unnamed protein product [Brassica oleracea]